MGVFLLRPDLPASDRSEAFMIWVQKGERLIMRGAVAGVAALILVQAWLYGSLGKTHLAALERLENGDPSEALAVLSTASGPPGAVAARGTVAIQLTNLPSAPGVRVLVNGTPMGDFGRGRVNLIVRTGDIIEIDGSRHQGQVILRVVAAGGTLDHLLGKEVTVRGTVNALTTRP